MANIQLEHFKAESFMGIDKSAPIFIDFTKMRKNQGFTEFAGDYGKRKTSTLMGIIYAMGGRFKIDSKKLLNSSDSSISEELVFKKDGARYKIEISADRVTVKREVDEKWTAKGVEQSPVEFVKDVFGPVGLFPFSLKEMKGKDQIEYFQDLFGNDPDANKKMKKLEEEIDSVFQDRRDINREVKAIENALNIEPLYQNYEKSQERFKNKINATKEKERYDELQKKKSAFEQYKNTLSAAEGELADTKNYIAELERKLSEAKKKEQDLSSSVEKGQKWVKDNEGIVQEFEKANEEWLNISRTLADQEKWKDILNKEKQMIEKQDQAMDLTAKLDEKREKLLKLTQSCLPKVEGLSIKVAAGIDKTDKPEGVFYRVPGKDEEQPLHQLSESEYGDMWCAIWEAAGFQHIFIENITSFGSNVVDTLNSFVKNGGNVYYTKMDRKLDEMEISFKSKID